MQFCTKCGKKLNGSKFCTKCGAIVKANRMNPLVNKTATVNSKPKAVKKASGFSYGKKKKSSTVKAMINETKDIYVKILAGILFLLIFLGIVIGTLSYFDIIEIPEFDTLFESQEIKDDESGKSEENTPKEEKVETESLKLYVG